MKRGPNKPSWPFTMNKACGQSVGLRAWWAGGITGAIASIDSSGFNNHLVMSSFASPFTRTSGWAEGVDGGRHALYFDGVDDVASLSPGQSAAFYYTSIQPFTVTFWAKIIAQPSNTVGFMAGVRVITVGNGWFIYWEKAGSRFAWGYQGINNLYHIRYSNGSKALNTWYHVTCYRDSSNTMGGTQIAINGVNDNGATDTPGTPNDFLPISSPRFCYGQDFQNTTYPSNVVMEDVRIYNRCLSTSDIRDLYDQDTRWALRWQSNPIILSRSGGVSLPGLQKLAGSRSSLAAASGRAG